MAGNTSDFTPLPTVLIAREECELRYVADESLIILERHFLTLLGGVSIVPPKCYILTRRPVVLSEACMLHGVAIWAIYDMANNS